MNVALWKARFSDHLELRRFSPRTAQGYVAELQPFFAFLQDRGVDALGELTRELVEAYRDHLFHATHEGKRLAVATQSGRLSAVKAFTRFLHREHFLLIDPGAGVELPRVPRTLPRVLLDEQEAAQVVEAPDASTVLGVRNRAILELLYGSGLRAAEICALELDDVLLGRREVRVRQGKGSKSRVVPLGDEAAAWIQAYVESARPCLVLHASERLLFVTCRGQKMHRVYLGRLVREAARVAGVDKTVTPHLLRHCCATHVLRRGAGLRHLQELLGHDSPATTQRYTRIELSDLQRVHTNCHPRERGRS